jgi:acetyl esterase
MPLHPEIAAKLAADASLGLLPIQTIPVVAARKQAESRPRPAGPAVAGLETVAIPVAGSTIAARIYRPSSVGAVQPALVFLHGGGWVLCSLDTHDAICRHLCVGADVVVVSVDYRMAPEHAFPLAADDCLAALRFVAARGASLGIDPDRLIVGGDSAGGNLAAVTALRARDEGGPALAGQMLIYPVTDHFSAGFASYRDYAEGCGLTAAEMVWFWNQYAPTQAQWSHPHAAPLRAEDLSRLPPAYVMTAECDVLRDEAEAYAARLVTAGVATTFRRFEGLNHGTAGLFGAFACVEPFRLDLLGWLRSVSRSRAEPG